MKMTTIALLRPMILSNVTNRMKCQIKKGNNNKHFHNSVCAKNPVAWTMDKGMGNTRNNDNDSKDQKWMTSNLGTKYQMLNGTLATLQGKVENLELKVENRALKENAEQKTLKTELMNHFLKDEFAKMLAIQNEQHQKEITQLESKYRMLEEKLSAVKLQTREMTASGVIEKQLGNPTRNRFHESNRNVKFSRDGLKMENTRSPLQHVYAEQGFDISGDSRKEGNFTGMIIYYFEVTGTSYGSFQIGLSNGSIPDGKLLGDSLNSYGVPNSNYCWISGKIHAFEWPVGATKPERVGMSAGDVEGCGLLLSPDNKLAIFFTFDDILIGKPIPISPSVHRLYPTVTMWPGVPLEANFGDNPAKPFNFDIAKCPRLVFP